jgi:hypothetical protein
MTEEAPTENVPRATRADVGRSQRGGLRAVAPADALRAMDPKPGEASQRLTLHSVTVTVGDNRCSVSVEVREGAEQSVAIAEGACAGSGMERLAAEATIRAAAGLDPGVARVSVEEVAVATVGRRVVATAMLVQPVGAGEEPLAGTAIVGSAGTVDAVARAVLEALARRSTSA